MNSQFGSFPSTWNLLTFNEFWNIKQTDFGNKNPSGKCMTSSQIQWLDGSGIDDSPLIWAENEPFPQTKNTTKPDNKKCWKRRKTPSCWRITSYQQDLLRNNTFFWGDHGIMVQTEYHFLKWHHWWLKNLLKAQQIAVPGPLDGHKPPLPICWGAEKAKREVERLRMKPNSWMIESTKSMVGNLWLENFQIPKILIVWVKWQALTN